MFKFAALGLTALVIVLAALMLSREPAVPARGRPAPTELAAGEDALRQLHRVRETGAGTLRLQEAALAGLAAIASRATGQERLKFELQADRVVAAGSRSLPLGLWLNYAVTARADPPGPPELRITLGRITLPGWATPLAIRAVREVLRVKGTEMPPVDEIVRNLAIGRDGIAARLRLPAGTDLAQTMAQLRGVRSIDSEAVLRAWCRLSEREREDSERSFAAQVRRAFGDSDGTAEGNRHAAIALAMLSVDIRAGDLAGVDRARAAECAARPASIRLAGREDLAGHWAMSAALAATLGVEAAQVAGLWKEMADSESGGSGFSFVDLAADRSGLRAARAAFAEPSAAATARRLAAATEEELLPRELLSLPEGLGDAEFRAEYGTTADPRYRAMVRRIDEALARRGVD